VTFRFAASTFPLAMTTRSCRAAASRRRFNSLKPSRTTTSCSASPSRRASARSQGFPGRSASSGSRA
jgi:hypothetical protein